MSRISLVLSHPKGARFKGKRGKRVRKTDSEATYPAKKSKELRTRKFVK